MAVARPVVATPVAGFRGLGGVTVAESGRFVEAVRAVVDGPLMPPGPGPLRRPPTWTAQAVKFLAVLDHAGGRAAAR